MGKAFPNPSKTGLCFASELPPRSVGRSLRAPVSSALQACRFRYAPTPHPCSAFALGQRLRGIPFLRYRHAPTESSRRGGRSRERTHSLETHKQGAAEWSCVRKSYNINACCLCSGSLMHVELDLTQRLIPFDETVCGRSSGSYPWAFSFSRLCA